MRLCIELRRDAASPAAAKRRPPAVACGAACDACGCGNACAAAAPQMVTKTVMVPTYVTEMRTVTAPSTSKSSASGPTRSTTGAGHRREDRRPTRSWSPRPRPRRSTTTSASRSTRPRRPSTRSGPLHRKVEQTLHGDGPDATRTRRSSTRSWFPTPKKPTRTYTVMVPCYEDKIVTYTVNVPYTEQVEQSYTVMVPHTEQRAETRTRRPSACRRRR